MKRQKTYIFCFKVFNKISFLIKNILCSDSLNLYTEFPKQKCAKLKQTLQMKISKKRILEA
jgi:hypothetical protein